MSKHSIFPDQVPTTSAGTSDFILKSNPLPQDYISAEHHALMLQVQRDRALEEAAQFWDELTSEDLNKGAITKACANDLHRRANAIRALKSTVPDDAAFSQFVKDVKTMCVYCKGAEAWDLIPTREDGGWFIHQSSILQAQRDCDANILRLANNDFSRRLNEQGAGSDKGKG